MGWWNKLVRDKKKEQATQEEVVEQTTEDIRRDALESEKEAATKAGEAWVAVLDTQVNKDNIRNGFFEIDWNNQFIEELLDVGYTGETNEEIVDQWFRTVVSQMLEEEGHSTTDRGAGYVNVVPLSKGKSEVS